LVALVAAAVGHVANPSLHLDHKTEGYLKDGFFEPGAKLKVRPYHAPPPFVEGSFKKAALARMVRQTKLVVAHETPAITAALKRRAVASGRAEATTAAKRAAKRAAWIGFKRTRALVEAKAAEYCHSISTIHQLPAMCKGTTHAMFSAMRKKGHLLQWANAAEDAAVMGASKYAAVAGFRAAAMPTVKKLKPLALKTATAVFNRMWAKYEAQWKQIERTHNSRVAFNKRVFFKNAANTISAHATYAIRKQLWHKDARVGVLRISRAAKRQAAVTSLKLVSKSLAPRFVAAAAKALPVAVKHASRQAMVMWEPHWNGITQAHAWKPYPTTTTTTTTTTVASTKAPVRLRSKPAKQWHPRRRTR